jgi:hypothetical protein
MELVYAAACKRWFFDQDEDARKAIEAVKSPGPWTEPISAATTQILTEMGLTEPWMIEEEAIGRLYEVHRAVRAEFHAAARKEAILNEAEQLL